MVFKLVNAETVDSGSFDGKILEYCFKDENERKYTVLVKVTDPYEEWKEQYNLNDKSILNFILLAIEGKLRKEAFTLDKLIIEIYSDAKPEINFDYEDFDILSYSIEID